MSLFALLGIAGLVLIGLAAREAWVLSRTPDLGIDVGTSGRVLAADDRWAGVEPGHRVVAVDGRPVAGQTDWMRSQRRVGSAPVTLTIAENDHVLKVAASPTPMSVPHRLALWVRVLTGGLLVLLGAAAFLLRPGDRESWLLLLGAWGLGAWLLGETVPSLLVPSLAVVMPLACAAFFHFLLVFPRPVPLLEHRIGSSLVLYAIPGALIAAQLASWLVAGSWDGADSYWAELHTARYVWMGLCAVGGTSAVVYHHLASRRSHDPTERARARGLLVGTALGFIAPAAVTVGRHVLGLPEPRFTAYYTSVPLLFFVGIGAYLAVRHNALAIDRFTGAIAGWSVTVSLAAVAFGAILLGLPLVLGGEAQASPPVLVALTAVVFAGSAPIYRWIRQRIDRRFFREYDAAARMRRALSDLMLAVRTPRQSDAIRAALSVVRALPSERVELWQLDDLGNRFARTTVAGRSSPEDAPEAIDREGPLGRAIDQRIDGGVDSLSPRPLPPAAQDELWSLSLALATPILVHGASIGFVGVERKPSGAAFTPEDLTFLTIVAGQLGLILERDRGDEIAVGRYRLERRLGVGGMAEVFLAWQLGPGGFERKVALKKPLPALAHEKGAIELFLDEARISAQLRHPNIAQVYEIGEADGSYYLAMEFVDGITLGTVLRVLGERGEAVPLPVAVRAIRDVVRALEHAHGATDGKGQPLDVVHRDVTPRNVMLSRDGELKLVDFGIARASSQLHTTQAGTVRGTLAYMSPEQAAGKPFDRRTDLYAAGAILFELVTGRRAFPAGPVQHPWKPEGAAPLESEEDRSGEETGDGQTESTRSARVMGTRGGSRPPPPMSTLAPDAPAGLDALFCRAVAFDPAVRFQSAGELLAELARVTEGIETATDAEMAELARRVARSR